MRIIISFIFILLLWVFRNRIFHFFTIQTNHFLSKQVINQTRSQNAKSDQYLSNVSIHHIRPITIESDKTYTLLTPFDILNSIALNFLYQFDHQIDILTLEK